MNQYALMGSIIANPGERDTLAAILLEAAVHVGRVPGCLQYIISINPEDAQAVYVNELWRSADDHRASLGDAETQTLIARARPLIASFGMRIVTTPLGGHGLPSV